MPATVHIQVCCRDRNGSFENCVRQVEFRGRDCSSLITLEAISLDRPPRIAFTEYFGRTRLMRIAGKTFPILGRRQYAGTNIFFDSLTVETSVAAALLNFLKASGKFTSGAGLSEFWDRWDSEGGEFMPKHIEDFVL